MIACSILKHYNLFSALILEPLHRTRGRLSRRTRMFTRVQYLL